MRLDKLLGQAGFGSRNQVKKLIRSRQVSVDGQIITKDNVIVDSGLQSIFVGKERVCLKERVLITFFISHQELFQQLEIQNIKQS